MLNRCDHLSYHCPIAATIDINVHLCLKENILRNTKMLKAPKLLNGINLLKITLLIHISNSEHNYEKINNIAELDMSNSTEVEDSVINLQKFRLVQLILKHLLEIIRRKTRRSQ